VGDEQGRRDKWQWLREAMSYNSKRQKCDARVPCTGTENNVVRGGVKLEATLFDDATYDHKAECLGTHGYQTRITRSLVLDCVYAVSLL
jgi:hypothetical protein